MKTWTLYLALKQNGNGTTWEAVRSAIQGHVFTAYSLTSFMDSLDRRGLQCRPDGKPIQRNRPWSEPRPGCCGMCCGQLNGHSTLLHDGISWCAMGHQFSRHRTILFRHVGIIFCMCGPSNCLCDLVRCSNGSWWQCLAMYARSYLAFLSHLASRFIASQCCHYCA